MTTTTSGKIRDLINAYLEPVSEPATPGPYFMNVKNDYDYTVYNDKESVPKTLTDHNANADTSNKTYGRGPSTQQNKQNKGGSYAPDGCRTDNSKIGFTAGGDDGLDPPGYINQMGEFTSDDLTDAKDNGKFISIVAISPGAGAGGAGSGSGSSDSTGSGTEAHRGGTGQGGSAGIAAIGQITITDPNVYITKCEWQVGGGGTGGLSGGNKDSGKHGFCGFGGGDTIMDITLSTEENIHIVLTSGNYGVGGGSGGSTSGSYQGTWNMDGKPAPSNVGTDNGGKSKDNEPTPGAITITINDDSNPLTFVDDYASYSNNSSYNIQFKRYSGDKVKGSDGQDSGKDGGQGGVITEDFYNDIKQYASYMINSDNRNIDTFINGDLSYSWDNSYTKMDNVKLGSGGLSAMATEGSAALNSFSGRAGFVSVFTYSSKPVGYPDVSE
jgi:hypothetical protein